MLKFTIFLISVVFLDCIFAAPLGGHGNTCKQECPKSSKDSKLKYLPGHLYSYTFDSNVAISLTGNDPQDIQLQVQGTARVYGLSANCQYGLDLQDVLVFGPDSSKKKFTENFSKLVRFTLADDKLEPEICAEDGESTVSLNIKRALISLLQLNDAAVEEVDIFGKCPTNYAHSKGDDGSLVVTKTRDLNACSHRESIINGFISGIFNDESNIKSTPLLNGDYTNEVHINQKGVVESAHVVEDYSLVPFTNGEAGVKARVVTKFRLKDVSANGNARLSVTVPRSLIYEHSQKPLKVDYQTAKKSLFAICDTYAQRNSVGAQVASQFTETIRLLRFLKQNDFLTLYNEASQLKDKPICRKVFLDAVFRVGTADSVNAIASLLSSNKINEKRLAYLAFNLATSVNKNTLSVLTKLIEKDPPKEGYLSIGNLIKKFLQSHPADDPELLKLLDKLGEKLATYNTDKRSQENSVVSILKGLRNAKGISGPILDRLIATANESPSGRVRAAAIQSFLAASEDSKIQTAALNILKNRKLDSEYRIEAYLVLVEGSNAQIASEVSKLLEDEPVYQVGSFITSHLANLRSSTDLHREKARQDFADVYSSKKFPSDFRKFSFNREFSYELGSLGLGGSSDTNVIYSQDSFTPRSLRTNFTGEIFGTSFNILELSARQENLDLLLERYFGPKGYFNTLNKEEALSKLIGSLHNEHRHKRSLHDDAEEFGKDANKDGNKDVDLDLSVKMFGSELYFLSLGDNFPTETKDFSSIVNKWVGGFLKGTKEGKKHSYDLHSLFLDAEFVYPTSIGFPLKLQTQGAGAFHLEASVKADLKGIKANPKATKFSVSVIPSYNVELSGILSVDGYEVLAGVKATSNLHSATGSAFSLELLNDGKGIDVKIDFPFKKQEIFSFDHKVVFIEQNLGHESVQHNLKVAQKKDTVSRNDCFDQFNKYLGVTVCYDVSHNPFKKGEKIANSRLFPLSGPVHVSAYIEIDSQYHFNALYDTTVPDKRSLDLTFDTPKSESSRKVQVKLEAALKPKVYLSAKVVSPYKSADAEIGINNDDKELTVYGQANSDASNYNAKFGFRKEGSEVRREYIPIIELTRPEAVQYKVSGKVIADKSQAPKTKYIFQKLAIEPLHDGRFGPLVLDGWVEYEKAHSLATDLDVQYKDKKGKVTGKLITKPQEVDFEFGIVSDFSEYANGKVQLHYKRSDKQCKNSFVLVYGPDLESTTKRIELTTDYEFEQEEKRFKSISGKNTLIISPIPVKVILNGSVRKNHFDYDLVTEFNKNSLSSKLVADASRKNAGDWDVKFNLAANKHKLEASSVRDITDGGKKSAVKSEVKSSYGTNILINANFDNHIDKQNANVVVDGTFLLARGQPQLKVDYKLLVSPKLAETSGKLASDKAEYVTFNGVLNRNGGDKNVPTTGTLNLVVKDFVTADGKYNSLKGDGKSELVVSFPRLERKVKVDTKYDYDANKFDLRNDFYYDFEKDNSKHIAFDTKNKHSAGSFDSVNELDINGEKFHFSIDGTKTGEFRKGKINGKFLLRLPTQREISGSIDRNVDILSPKATGHANLKITDTLTKAQKSRSIELDGTLKDGNRELRYIDMLHKITLTDFDGKQIVIDQHIKNLPKGEYKTAYGSLRISGSLPNPIELSIGVDEYCPVHAIYHANVKYGTTVDISLNGDYAVGEVGGKPSSYKLNGQISVPQTKLRQLTFDTRGSLKQPDLKDPKGQYEFDFKLHSKAGDKDLSIETNGKASKSHGELNVDVKLPDAEPFATDLSYNYDKQGEQHRASGNVQVRYGNGKNIKFAGDVSGIENKEVLVHGSVTTPYEKAKSLEFTFKTQRKDEHSYASEAELVLDDKKYKLTNAVVVSRLNPSIQIDAYYPSGHSQVAASLSRLNDRKYKSTLRIVNLNGFHLTSDAELSYQSIENFGLIFDLDSEALKANKLHIDIHSKQNGNNKGIEFSATEKDKNIVSGTADYQVKEEKGKTTVEGKGNVNWYDKSSAITFQFMKNTFDEAHNNETGVMLVFNGQIGPKNIQAELKVTNKEFHIRHTICESVKPCINLSVSSSLSDLDWTHFTHNLLVTIDLRKLGFAHEFNLKADTKRDGLAIYHTLDTHIQSADQHKYQYNVYVNPESAGVVLSIPTRTSAIEATYKYPKNYIGQYQATITSYLDKKNNPAKHSTIGFSGEVKRQGKYTFIATGALTASHPSVKELKISGESVLNGDEHFVSSKVTFDLFKQTNQAIVVTARYASTDSSLKGFNVTSELSLKSSGLGLDYSFNENAALSFPRRQLAFTSEFVGPTANERFGVYVSANEKSVEASVVVLNDELLKASAEIDAQKKSAALKSQIKLLGSDPIETETKVSPSGANAHIKHANYLLIDAEAAPGKALTFKATGNSKQLLNIRVALDSANLLSTDYDVNDKEFKEFLKNAKTKLSEDSKRSRNEFESRINHAKQSLTSQVNAIKDNLPDFSKLNADYKEEFEKFTEALLSDKSIKELVEFYKKTYDVLNKSVGEILRTLVEHFNKISKTVTDLFKQLYDGFNERILPSLKESFAHIEQALTNLYDETVNLLLHLFDKLVESLKKFEEDFKKIGKTVAEFFKKAGKHFNELFTVIQRNLEDLYKLVLDYVKALPGLEALKEKYTETLNNLVIPENVIHTLRELAETLKHALQVKELNELITSIIDYIQLKLEKKPVNDAEELKKIAEKFYNALKSLLLLAKDHLGSLGVDASSEYYGLPIPSFQKLQVLPQITTLKVSVWNYLVHERIPSLKDLFITYRPHAFNPINVVPPFLIEGRIIDGQYLFTFGGEQITLPGVTKYVVAKDIVDGNFTVIADIADGKLQSIAVVDKSGDSVEISHTGKVTQNDAPSDLPVQGKTLYAWRTYYSTSILSSYGVHVHCKLDLKVCHVNVNGYYHSKLRGLLGKGGYETYDEKTLPNGKLADSTTEFVNAYKLKGSSPNVNIDEGHKHSDDATSVECDNVFGSGPGLRLAKFIIDPTKYIQACQHAVQHAANKQEAACDIAFGYASFALNENIPVRMPSVCQKCEVNGKSYEIGETYKPPVAKKADVVLVADTAIEEGVLTPLVQNFITELRHSLKKDYDTHVSVIGYKKGNTHIKHYTSDGKLDITNFHLDKHPENSLQDAKLLSVGCEYVDPILQKLHNISLRIQDELSLSADGRAFREALSYPFRSNAQKIIVAIRSDILTHSSNPFKLLGAKAVNEIAKGVGVTVHMIAPTPDLKFDNNKDHKDVVGFNDKSVLYMPGHKGRSQDRQHLEYGTDLGIDVVQSSNHGYSFSLTNYLQQPAADQRKFLKVAASAIGSQITKTESVNECICGLHRGLFAREVCRETEKVNKSR